MAAAAEWGWTAAPVPELDAPRLAAEFPGSWIHSVLLQGSLHPRSPSLSPISPSSRPRPLQNEMGTVMNSSEEIEPLLQPYNFEQLQGLQDIILFLREYW